jgi:hypothetical protein
MVATYDEAVGELFQGPHATFVAERKRLAGELKAAGDKAGATTLGKLGRPPISAWAVNQLWWQARLEFDALLETAKRMRGGDLGATPAHRDALNALKTRAAKILADAGNAAQDATLRRVATTLSAIAAHGGFGPDAAGALTEDRDPPGFDAIGMVAPVAPVVAPPPAAVTLKPGGEPDAAAAETERQRLLAAAAEQHRHELEVKKARAEVDRLQLELEEKHREVMRTEGQLVQARALLAQLIG